jgi:predicted O-methyltransferase YrrM
VLKNKNWFSLSLSLMNRWFQLKEFLKYGFIAKEAHSLHSPFLFDFYQKVLQDRRQFYCYVEIEKLRHQLKNDDRLIPVKDYGAASKKISPDGRAISSIVKRSVTGKRYGQLLFRIANHFNSKAILELGTSLGITSLYFSSSNPQARVITMEGDENLAALAEQNFNALNRKNITLVRGLFDVHLHEVISSLQTIDMAYIDGNHRRKPTVNYFRQILPFTHEHSVIIIDDIHWSHEMQQAWNEIIQLPQITVTVDLFRMGIIFFRKELSKQHFVLRW